MFHHMGTDPHIILNVIATNGTIRETKQSYTKFDNGTHAYKSRKTFVKLNYTKLIKTIHNFTKLYKTFTKLHKTLQESTIFFINLCLYTIDKIAQDFFQQTVHTLYSTLRICLIPYKTFIKQKIRRIFK